MLMDVEVMGGAVLADWAAEEVDRDKVRESVRVVAAQWIVYKSWADKVNLMVQSLLPLEKTGLQSRVQQIIESQLGGQGHLWIPEYLTGTYSSCSQGKRLVALPENGLLQQAYLTLQPVECG